jgi:hypothetical protein
MILPPEAIPLITAPAPAFTQPTHRRFVARRGRLPTPLRDVLLVAPAPAA